MNFNVRPMLTLALRFGSLPLAIALLTWSGGLLFQQFVMREQLGATQKILPPDNIYQVSIVHFALSLLALGCVLIVAFLAARADPSDKLDEISTKLANDVKHARADVQLMAAQLNTLAVDVSGLKLDNARFVHLGFIGLQEAACEIERIRKDHAPLRYAISRHLPSHLREKDLSMAEAHPLYATWEPANRLRDYVRLINQRRFEQTAYVESGGDCWEFFSKPDLEEYAAAGSTPFDAVEDSVEERLSRFRRLIALLEHDNYHLCLMHQPPTMTLLLRTSSGVQSSARSNALLLDLRLPNSQTNFEESSYGIVTHDEETVVTYKRRVDRMLGQAREKGRADTDKAALRILIETWIKGLEGRLQQGTTSS